MAAQTAYSGATEILPGMWLGDIGATHDREFLETKMIQCIVNCTVDHPFTSLTQIKVKYRLPVVEHPDLNMLAQLYELLDEVGHKIQQYTRKYNLLIHGYPGTKNVEVAIMMAYLIKYGQLEIDQAFELLRSKNPDVTIVQPDLVSVLELYAQAVLTDTE